MSQEHIISNSLSAHIAIPQKFAWAHFIQKKSYMNTQRSKSANFYHSFSLTPWACTGGPSRHCLYQCLGPSLSNTMASIHGGPHILCTVEPVYYGDIRTSQKCPDYQGVLIFQVSLHDNVSFGTTARCVD